MAAALDNRSARPVRRVSDELAWELLRDEWELLLAIGAGPTALGDAARRLGECPDALAPRVELLVEHGLLSEVPGGVAMVPAFHKRQEGMSSYLRDLVLARIDLAGCPPIGALVRRELGGEDALRALLGRAESNLLPAVVSAASAPESDASERFLAVFAVTSACTPGPSDREGLVGEVMAVLRAAALERANDANVAPSKLWVAEMRVDPDVASGISDAMEAFLSEEPGGDGPGAATFAVWPVRARAPGRPRDKVGS
ncbi:MAG: hypothetical protein H6744_06525 [Deltaproteobacteria bacterium]|nr:hypothetical protein [Deltaproteobacteria bacterium]MCB9786336.1 hypothetical protein [Deltaproteobacteria bacterium]